MNTRHVVFDNDKYCDGCPFFKVNENDQRISYCRAMNGGLGKGMRQEWFENSYYRTRRSNCPLPVAIMPPEEVVATDGSVMSPPSLFQPGDEVILVWIPEQPSIRDMKHLHLKRARVIGRASHPSHVQVCCDGGEGSWPCRLVVLESVADAVMTMGRC